MVYHLTDERYYAEMQEQARLFADAVHGADLAGPVPTCPEWTVTDLVLHVARAHRWASVIVERRATDRVRNAEADDMDLPDSADGRSRWLLAGARRLVGAIRELGPQARVWTWATDQTAGFWLRKILHDTLIHRVDAQLIGGRADRLAPDLAGDNVCDLLTSFTNLSSPRHPDPAFAALRGEGQVLSLRATDPELGRAGQWLVRRAPGGVAWEHGTGDADVEVRGSAEELALVLNRRADPTRVAVTGNRELFAHWLAHSAF